MAEKKIPCSEEAYHKIKEMIINLHFRPGEIIYTLELSKELNISRTPTREALVKLAQEGLLNYTDSRKFRVVEVTEELVRDIYELRLSFEIMAMRGIIDKIGDRDIEFLESNISQMKSAYEDKKVKDFFNLDNQFHNYYVNLYHNNLMKGFLNQLTDQQQRIRYITVYVDGRMSLTIPEHEEILHALKERNLEKVEKAVAGHIKHTEDTTIQFLKNKEVAKLSLL